MACTDLLCVRTDELRAVLLPEWEARNKRGTNHMGKHPGGGSARGMGGTECLHHWSGVQQRMIYTIMMQRSNHTSLTNADKLLLAIDEVGALYDGRCPVRRWPRWNKEHWLKRMKAAGVSECDDILEP